MAQTEHKLPYYEIPQQSGDYSAGTVASRMLDGLGFRYYWATEGLRPEDLNYKPGDSGRSSEETVDHIYGLSQFILNTLAVNIENQPDVKAMSFEEKRKQTLENIKTSSELLKNTTDLSKFDNDRFPFWNIINGPISDAIWHCGQLVLLRRASGNPYNSKASVFSGKVRE
ncbi:hypothetical protein [Gaetbulibacter aestuarii]|uniref:DinB family protein n=1 Tax=Gaetbulibacter aestuarii TaxID=1502358 RepID=A0ABW7MXR5_9FLAO